MTESKQFKIIGEEFISYYGGSAQLISDGECKFHLWEVPKDAQKVCDKLNNLLFENFELKFLNQELQNKITQQYELLGRIAELIRKQDWETLSKAVTEYDTLLELIKKEFQSLGVKPCDTNE